MLSDTTAAADVAAAPPEADTGPRLSLRQPLYLVCLTGRADAGKDSCAAHLARYGFHRLAFADALRAEVQAAWGCGPTLLGNRETKELPLSSLSVSHCWRDEFGVWAHAQGHDLNRPRSPRWVLQTYGEWRRAVKGPWYWIAFVAGAIGRLAGQGNSGRRIVITDVRYAAEWDFLSRMDGAKLLRVIRPDQPRPLADDTAEHVSEVQARALPAINEVHNDGTLQHLGNEIERVVTLHWGTDALDNTRGAAQ